MQRHFKEHYAIGCEAGPAKTCHPELESGLAAECGSLNKVDSRIELGLSDLAGKDIDKAKTYFSKVLKAYFRVTPPNGTKLKTTDNCGIVSFMHEVR